MGKYTLIEDSYEGHYIILITHKGVKMFSYEMHTLKGWADKLGARIEDFEIKSRF